MKHPVIEEIKKEIYFSGLMQKEAEFSCYADQILTYQIKAENCIHEFCIINEDDTFFNKEKVVDLLDMKNNLYLRHSIYSTQVINGEESTSLIDSRTYKKDIE